MAVIEIVALGLVLLVIVLVVGMLTGRPGGARAMPSVAVVRLTGHKDGHEELQLRINDQLIRGVSDLGLRPGDFQTQSDELERLASSVAAALGVEVWLRRADVRERSGLADAK